MILSVDDLLTSFLLALVICIHMQIAVEMSTYEAANQTVEEVYISTGYNGSLETLIITQQAKLSSDDS